MGQGEYRRGFGAYERFPPLADQMRARPELGDGPRAHEGRPRGGGLGIEQVEGGSGAHSFCTRAFSFSARPVGMTSVWPLARTTTMSVTPVTARCSSSVQITERRTSSPRETFPTTTLPSTSGVRMR